MQFIKALLEKQGLHLAREIDGSDWVLNGQERKGFWNFSTHFVSRLLFAVRMCGTRMNANKFMTSSITYIQNLHAKLIIL